MKIIDEVKKELKQHKTVDDKMEFINKLSAELHKLSPLKTEPVDNVIWVKADEVYANDYNPNSVAPPEMELLQHSIDHDGYTQPIVTWKTDKGYEVVDGFHRSRVGKEVESVAKRVKGYLPIVGVNKSSTSRNDRVAATVRHNRARGKHSVDGMAEIILDLKRRNWSDKKISKEETINMYKYVRALSNDLYRKKEFWDQQENHKEYSFEDLKSWCGLTLKDEVKSQEWWHALKRNIKPTEITYVKILLQKYGQDQLDNDPTIIIDTVHSVKGGEADNVLVYFKAFLSI